MGYQDIAMRVVYAGGGTAVTLVQDLLRQRDAEIKRLRKLESDTYREFMDRIADYFLKPRWVLAEYELPEKDEPVLCCFSRQKQGIAVARFGEFAGKSAWREINGQDEVEDPIAWMPLPPLP